MFVGKFLTVWIRIFQWIAHPSLLRSWTSCDLNFNNYLNEETLWNKTKTTKNSMLTLTEIVSVVNHPCRNKWLSHSTVVNTLKERIKKKKKKNLPDWQFELIGNNKQYIQKHILHNIETGCKYLHDKKTNPAKFFKGETFIWKFGLWLTRLGTRLFRFVY